VSLFLGNILFSILIPRGPVQGPWQLLSIMTGFFQANLYLTIVYIVKNLTESAYSAAKMLSKLPGNVDIIFNGTMMYIVVCSIASTVGNNARVVVPF